MATSQVSAADWHSFEMRMRQRRATRLVVRAQAALEQGLMADAAAALDEARGLDSATPDLQTLLARMPPLEAATDIPVMIETPVVFETPVVEPDMVSSRDRRAGGWIAVAGSLAIIAVLVVWGMDRLRPALVASPESSITPPAPAVVIPEEPIAATSGHVETTAMKAPEPPAVNGSLTEPAGDAGATRLDPAPSVPSPAQPPASAGPAATAAPPAAAPSLPESPRAEPLRDLPVTERISTAPSEAAVATPAVPSAPSTSDVGVPAPVVAPPVEPPPPEPPRIDETPLVRRVLSQYEAAYSSLDVSEAKRAWPSVDTLALARAFDGLQAQRISLGDCRVALTGATARADCRGSAEWTPKIGGATRSGPRSWSFDLRKTDGQWRIVDVTMR